MFSRWFVGTYSVSVITGFITAPWAFPDAAAPAVGFFFIPFALPFVVIGCLIGQGMQWALQRLMAPGWERTGILSCATAAAAGTGMHLITGTPMYVLIGGCAALVGTVMSQHEAAWRWGWLIVAVGACVASGLVIYALPKPT